MLPNLPKVGDSVFVQHRSWIDIKGVAHIVSAKSTEKRIDAVYHSGKVRDHSGDTWNVMCIGDGKFRTTAEA